jgi:hypothetical protein
MSLYASIVIATLVGLWLHRRVGPNRGTALFVIGGLVLGAAIGIAVSEDRRDRNFERRFDRALSRIACSYAHDATTASFPSWSIEVVVVKDAAMMFSRMPLVKSVRLVDAHGELLVELALEGTSTVVRDARILRAHTAVLVDGTTVHRVPLRPGPAGCVGSRRG